MKEISADYKIKFHQYLNGDISIREFEDFISFNIVLEIELGSDIYIELLTFDYNDKNAPDILDDYLFENLIDEGEFETWKIKELLSLFINSPEQIQHLLEKFYDLYCKSYDRNEQLVNNYKFLGHLALNYFHWMEEGYLRLNHGNEWQKAYQEALEDFPFYHEQLRPIAELIIKALDEKEIKICKQGQYSIAENLRRHLESDSIIVLKHSPRQEEINIWKVK